MDSRVQVKVNFSLVQVLREGYGTLAALFLACFLVLSSGKVAAQLVKRDTLINGTLLSLRMDARIDEFLKEAERECERKASTIYVSPEGFVFDKNLEDETSEICKKYPKLNGYKIQVEVLNDHQKARDLSSRLRREFPDLRVELDTQFRPHYKILVGSFFSEQSALEDFERLKSKFPRAEIVPHRIFCVESK